MALDDPIVWILIVAVIVFLFGSNKIPEIAKAIGQAKRELDGAMKGMTDQTNYAMNAATSPQQSARALVPPGAISNPAPKVTQPSTTSTSTSDPLIIAAKSEGIDTQGKTRDQIATELAVKLNSDRK